MRCIFFVERLLQLTVFDNHFEDSILMAVLLGEFIRFDEEIAERLLFTFNDKDGHATLLGFEPCIPRYLGQLRN